MRNASSTHRSNRSKGRHRLLLPILLLGGVLAFLMPEGVSAQPMRWVMPDSVQPLDQVYNVGDDEFIVGLLYSKPTRDPSGTVNILWEFARYMNAADWIWGVGYHRGTSDEDVAHNYKVQLDSLLTLADSGERYLASISPFGDVAGSNLGNNGQMLEVFFFDSVQSPYSVWKFLDVDAEKGELKANLYYDNSSGDRYDWPWKSEYPNERKFTNVQDSGLIAQHLAVAYNTTTNPTWLSHISNEWEADHFFNLVYSTKGELERELSVALKGHLSDVPDNLISPGAPIFRIELYHVVPQGKNYLEYLNPTTDTLITTTAYTERLIDTFTVTKGDLLEGTKDNAAYRDVSFTTDLRYRFGDSTKYGPLAKEFPWKYRDNGAILFDVKVYWTGKEEPSVRSLMLRNPMAQLMYGTSQESEDFRKEVIDSARRVLHGLNGQGEPDLSAPYRKSVMRLDSGHEPFDYGLGSFRALKRYINDSLVYNNGADTVQVGIIMNNGSLQKHMQHVGGMEAVHIEYGYMNFGYDKSTRRVVPLKDSTIVSLPFYELPAIAEHNGGGGSNFSGPPELKLTTDSITMYTEAMQRGFYGFYTSNGDKSGHGGGVVQDLGYGARAAATFGRALYGIAGTVSRLVIDTSNVSWVTIPADTTILNGDTTIVEAYDSLTSTPVLHAISRISQRFRRCVRTQISSSSSGVKVLPTTGWELLLPF